MQYQVPILHRQLSILSLHTPHSRVLAPRHSTVLPRGYDAAAYGWLHTLVLRLPVQVVYGNWQGRLLHNHQGTVDHSHNLPLTLRNLHTTRYLQVPRHTLMSGVSYSVLHRQQAHLRTNNY